MAIRKTITESPFNVINNPYVLPVKRIGNSRNPKLVILLSNPGEDWRMPKRLPDYTMYLDGKYKDQDGLIRIAQEYNAWWDDIVEVARVNGIEPENILALEYYPYHTISSAEIPKYNEWTDYAKSALDENIEILQKCIKDGAIIFGYYHGFWSRKVEELSMHPKFYKSTQAWKSNKIKELHVFLKSGGSL